MTNDIAIIGKAARLPGANNLDELLNIFVEGKDYVTGISENNCPGLFNHQNIRSLRNLIIAKTKTTKNPEILINEIEF